MAHGYHAIGVQTGEVSPSSSSASKQLYGSSPSSFENFYNSQGYGSGNPYDFWNRIGNFFTGNVSSAEQAYQNYLADYEYKKNQEATAAANKETYAREDSQTQRLIADATSAGVNPYVLLGGLSASVGGTSSQAQRPDYKRSSKKSRERSGNGSVLGTALKLLAILALKG